MRIRGKELSLNFCINLLRIVLLVSHNSFGAETIHFVFLEISGSLDWSVMSQIPPLANYSRSSNYCLLVNFSSAGFIRQLSWWYKSVVKEDCNFSNFGTEAFLVSCYLGHRFCTRCLTGEIHSTVMTKIKWSWHFFGADHRKVPNRPQNAQSSTLFKVHA